MRNFVRAALVALTLISLAACSVGGPTTSPTSGAPTASPELTDSPTAGARGELTLLTHDSFAVTPGVLAEFEAANNVTVRVFKAGDAGSMVNQAILTKDNPLADVLFGVDSTFLSRALDEDIFEPYHAVGVDAVPAALRLDARERVTPIDYGDVCVNYDRDAFADLAAVPQTLADLTAPVYRSQLVVEDPATSSPGLAFMLATIARFGETGDYTWRDYWRGLRVNDVRVETGWDQAYYGSFSGGSGTGDRPMVVSYATSPAAEVFYASLPPAVAPTGVITDGCFRQVEFAGVLAGTRHPDLARALVDFMLSAEFQADIPLNMFVFPAVPTTPLPSVFADNAAHVAAPLSLPPEAIAANRERWLAEWGAAASASRIP